MTRHSLITRSKFSDNIGTGSYFNICKSFRPGWSAHQPQKSGNKSNDKVRHGELPAVAIQARVAEVEQERGHAVEEDEDGEGDVELRRGGVVPDEHVVSPLHITHVHTRGGLERHLIQPLAMLCNFGREGVGDGEARTNYRALAIWHIFEILLNHQNSLNRYYFQFIGQKNWVLERSNKVVSGKRFTPWLQHRTFNKLFNDSWSQTDEFTNKIFISVWE